MFLQLTGSIRNHWNLFFTLIISCTDTTAAPGDLKFHHQYVGLKVYDNPFKFQEDGICKCMDIIMFVYVCACMCVCCGVSFNLSMCPSQITNGQV